MSAQFLRKRLPTLSVFLILIVIFAVPAFAEESIQISGPTMGTYYRVVLDSPPADLDAEALQEKIELRLKEINSRMSTWDKSSEISKFNQLKSTDWFEVSSEFATVAAEAKRIHKLTDGAFDPTIEPLIRLWGFGDARRKEVPDEKDVTAALKFVGMQHLGVRHTPPALKKAVPELQLNLSAIAKGYAVDALAELLAGEGLSAHVVDIGGENKAGTAKASGDPWKLGVESPLGGIRRIVELTESSIATSGDYRNFFQMDGVTYSHAIDPETGWPVKEPPASVSVVSESCMTADAWATAMMVLKVEKGIQTAKDNDLSVMFQQVEDDGQIRETVHGLFASSSDEQSVSGPSSSSAAPGQKPASAPWFPFAAAAVIFLIAAAGMAVGTMLQNKSLKGSCGGLASMPGSEGKSICELCTVPKEECTNAELREKMQAAAASSCNETDC